MHFESIKSILDRKTKLDFHESKLLHFDFFRKHFDFFNWSLILAFLQFLINFFHNCTARNSRKFMQDFFFHTALYFQISNLPLSLCTYLRTSICSCYVCFSLKQWKNALNFFLIKVSKFRFLQSKDINKFRDLDFERNLSK